jgi:hypothetical protein
MEHSIFVVSDNGIQLAAPACVISSTVLYSMLYVNLAISTAHLRSGAAVLSRTFYLKPKKWALGTIIIHNSKSCSFKCFLKRFTLPVIADASLFGCAYSVLFVKMPGWKGTGWYDPSDEYRQAPHLLPMVRRHKSKAVKVCCWAWPHCHPTSFYSKPTTDLVR